MENRKLELAFVDKHGKVYSLEDATREDLSKGLERISREIAKRLQLQKEQR